MGSQALQETSRDRSPSPSPSLSGDCQHRIRETDPHTGRTYCHDRCGCEIPDEPILVGTRLITPTEWLSRYAIKYRELEAEGEQKYLELREIQRKKDWIVSIAGSLQNTKCHWPECDAKPRLRSNWCEKHKTLRERETARGRQQRRRERLSRLPTPVTPAPPVLLRKTRCQ